MNNFMKWIQCILLIALPFWGFTQEKSFLTNNDWSKIINNLSNENWDSANKEASIFLGKYTGVNINNRDAGVLRYMFIISESGLVNEKKIEGTTALDSIKKFIGLKIILPGRKLSVKHGLNVIIPYHNNTDTLFTTATNKIETEIFCFEYIIPDKKIPMVEFKRTIGWIATFEGILSSIKLDGQTLPRYKLYISDATVNISPPNK